MARATVKCWLCGVEPLEVCETTTLGDPEPTYIAGRWPAAAEGHHHAERPPTPGELEQAGHQALMRIMTVSDHC